MADDLRELCETFLRGDLAVTRFLSACLQHSSAHLPLAQVDHDRLDRCGFPEVIYAEGKPTESLLRIAEELAQTGNPVLATRVNPDQQLQLRERFPDAIVNEHARTFRLAGQRPAAAFGKVPVLAAGTSDVAVAEEALETLTWMGVNCFTIYDIGVAGPHRLPAHIERLADSDAVVVVAGMEGALPSVVGGYVSCPVIAVPTSVGYGASFQGVAALLSMLNSCASNVSVVNIDAGFKAGYVAGLTAYGVHRRAAKRTTTADRTPDE